MNLSLKNWKGWSESIAFPAEPTEHSPAAVEKLMSAIGDYVVDVKGVRPQFHARNSVMMIDFSTPEERAEYERAYEEYLAKKAKLEGENGPGNSRFMILVQFLKFRQKAELIRAPYLAQAMYDSVQAGEAAVCAMNFKASIAKCVKILHDTYGVSRDNISLIWGGGNTSMSKKKKKKLDMRGRLESSEKMMAMMKEEGLSLEDFDLADVEEAIRVEIDDTLDLGMQSKKERQRQIDRFQSGKSLYCFYTFKSGGVGLSLHHTDELTTDWNRTHPEFARWFEKINALPIEERPKPGKVRKQENGYAVLEDIKFIPTRPRRTFLTPTYSAIELVQGLGRAPRLTSLSDTPQTVIFYRGTIEERVALTVSIKLKCLRKVVRQRESWEEVILGQNNRWKQEDELPKQLVDSQPNEADEDSEDLIGVSASDESEEDDE